MELCSIIPERLLLLSVLAIPLLLVIAVFRILFSNISKRYVLFLWAVLALRLICPVIVTNPFSILPAFSGETVRNMLVAVDKVLPHGAFLEEEAKQAEEQAKQTVSDTKQAVEEAGLTKETISDTKQVLEEELAKETVSDTKQASEEEVQESSVLPKQEIMDRSTVSGEHFLLGNTKGTGFFLIWVSVCCLLWGYGLLRGVLLRFKLRDAVPLEKGVYSSDRIKEPFACGIVKPRIYLPSGMAGEHKEAVLSHEREHIRHQDTRINVFAYLLVCVYWFSPVILAAYFLFLTDLEMACDERAIRRLDGGGKQKYANALLACGSGHLLPGFYPMAFGESGVSKRIQNIIKGTVLSPRAGKGMLVLVLLLTVCLGSGCERLVLDGENTDLSEEEQLTSVTEELVRTVEWQEDITEDKKPDSITVDVSALTDETGAVLSAEDYKGNGKEATVRVASGKTGKEIYTVSINPAKKRGGLYLYKRKLSHWMSIETEKTFFLLWEPPASAGEETYHYEIFSLSEEGEKRIEEERDFTREEKLPQRNQTYLEQVNEYLFHSIALLDTVGGITQYSEQEQQITLLYDAEENCSKPAILGAARDTIEESDFIRIKSNEGWNPLQSAYPGIPFYVASQEEWQCGDRYRVYFHYEDKDAKFFGYRNEEEIEAKEGEERYKENFIRVNSWELSPGWAPYIIWSPASYTAYKERVDAYYVTAYVVDEQETKLLAKQTIVIEWRENESKVESYYVRE